MGLAFASSAATEPTELSTRQTVDMVRAGDFTRLDRYYSVVQASYDAGRLSDRKLRSAFRHFYDTSPDLAARYASWVQEMPRSYVAHLARAIYYLRLGEQSRGNLIIADTSQARRNGMDAALAQSDKELQKSAVLDRKPLMSIFYELDIGKFYGDAVGNRQLLQASLAIEPKNFIVRQMYMMTLQTAWGGSTAQMEAFLHSCKAAGLPAADLNEFTAQVFANEAWVDGNRKDFKRSAAEYLDAYKLTPDAVCLLCAGRALVNAGDYKKGVQVLNEYLIKEPKSTDALSLRASAYFQLKRNRAGIRDCRRAAALGNGWCEYVIGFGYVVGYYDLPKNRTAGIKWLTLAAKQGNEDAQKLLPVALNPRMNILLTPH